MVFVCVMMDLSIVLRLEPIREFKQKLSVIRSPAMQLVPSLQMFPESCIPKMASHLSNM